MTQKEEIAIGLAVVVGVLIIANRSTTSDRRRTRTAEPKSPNAADNEWQPALLSEYYPDAPASERRREGGPLDRMKTDIITYDQFISDSAKYPYVSVSSDLELRGKPVPYGSRIYFAKYPDVVFRLVDTGENFKGDTKVIREPGYEPFDIPVPYSHKRQFMHAKTFYRIDRTDTVKPGPRPKVV